jgi:hypothetical protein
VSSSSTGCNSSKAGPKAFSMAAYGSNKVVTGIRPFLTTTTVSASAASSSPIHTNANDAIFENSSSSNSIIRRSMATSNRKVIDAKNAKRLKIQQKKKKNTNVSKVRFGFGYTVVF